MFEVSWNSWMLVNYLKYMANQTDSQLPMLKVLDLKLIYSGQLQDDRGYWTSLIGGNLRFGLIFFLKLSTLAIFFCSLKEFVTDFLRNSLSSFLEIGAFCTQFLNVWNAEGSNPNIVFLPTVPAPEVSFSHTFHRGIQSTTGVSHILSYFVSYFV